MLPKKIIHIVNDKQLCDKQYAYYREGLGYQRGYQAGMKLVAGFIEEYDLLRKNEAWQAQLEEWGIKSA